MAEKFDWNQYQEAGPDYWNQFEEQPLTADQIVNERAPQVSVGDRMIAKNLAQSPRAQAEYLKKQYPGLEIKVSGGDVLIKDGDSFKKLDPSTFEAEDVTDVLDTIVSGITSTAGTVLGGLAGAPTGVGAVPGALAGTAAAGAATEAFRQKLGQKLGIPQDVSGGDVAMAGAGNLIGAGLLGTGAIPKGAYKGLIRDAWNKGVPQAAQFWTGVTPDVLQTYSSPASREEVKSLIKGGKTEFTEKLVDKIRGGLNQQKQEVGAKLAGAIDNASEPVNIANIKQNYRTLIDQLQSEFDAVPNVINKEKLESAKATFSQIFNKADDLASEIPDTLKPSQAFRLQGDLKDFGDLKRTGQGINPRYASNATQSEKQLSDEALNAYRGINKELDRVTEGASPEFKAQYSQLKDIEGTLSPSLRTDQSAYSTFTNLDGKSKVAFKEALEKLGQRTGDDYTKPITMLQAADYFGSNSWTPRSIGGTTSTTRTLPGVVGGGLIGASIGSKMGPLGGAAGGVIGSSVGAASASPRALRAVIESTDGVRSVADQFGRLMDVGYVTPLTREVLVQSPWLGM